MAEGDLISRKQALKELREELRERRAYGEEAGGESILLAEGIEIAINAVKRVKAADVVSVVNCRDCKHARKSKEVFEFDAVTPLCECSYMKLPHRWYEYCSWGERRKENA